MKWRRLAGAAALVLSTPAMAADGAIWNQYQKLTCRDDVYVTCTASATTCERSAGSAIFAFDFSASTFKSLAATASGSITARQFAAIPPLGDMPSDTGTIFLSWGDVITFRYPIKTPGGLVADEIPAIGQSSGSGMAITRFMTCRPS